MTTDPVEARLRPRAARIVGAASHAFLRGARGTLYATSIALLGAVVAFVLLHHFDVGAVAVQVTVALVVLVVAFVAALVPIAAATERERDHWRRDFLVRQTREGVHRTIYETVSAVRLTLEKPDEEITDADPRWYAEGALRAAKSDEYGSIQRQRELEAFLQPSDEASPRERLEELERLLVSNLVQGLYLRG